MDIKQAMYERHSVRNYKDEPIKENDVKLINNKIDEINKKSGLHFYLVLNEPNCFSGNKTHYGDFSCVKNYIVLTGSKNRSVDVGYYGEELVLYLQSIGINTCWVAVTFNWTKVKRNKDAKRFYLLISIGYGVNNGIKGHSKPLDKLSNITDNSPEWFKKGMEAVALAPSTMHKQQFYFRLNQDNTVTAVPVFGLFYKIDLGIGMYHFEIGAGKDSFKWSK